MTDTADPREAAQPTEAAQRVASLRHYLVDAIVPLTGSEAEAVALVVEFEDRVRALATEPSAGVTSEAGVVRAGEVVDLRLEPGARLNLAGARDALAAQIMAALNEHGASYSLPRDPSDLAYLVADALTPSTSTETTRDACGSPAVGGRPCVLPRGHNMGRVDIPEYHRAATTPSVSDEGLDVERLARAMVGALNFYVLPPRVVGDPFWRERAEAIAAEYAALATTSEEPVSG